MLAISRPAARTPGDASRAAGGGASEDLRLYCLATLALAEVLRGQLFGRAGTPSVGRAACRGDRRPCEPSSRVAAAGRRLGGAGAAGALQGATPSGRAVRLQEIGDDALLCAVSALLQARLMRDRGDRAGAREILEKVEPPAGWLRGYPRRRGRRTGLGGSAPRSAPIMKPSRRQAGAGADQAR